MSLPISLQPDFFVISDIFGLCFLVHLVYLLVPVVAASFFCFFYWDYFVGFVLEVAGVLAHFASAWFCLRFCSVFFFRFVWDFAWGLANFAGG